MIKYRHQLRFIEGSVESGNFEDVATLTYVGELPSVPSPGLVVSLTDDVDFEIQHVSFLVHEGIYQSFSYIDFYALDDRSQAFVGREDWIARWVKYGFEIYSTNRVSKEAIEAAVEDVIV
ncbi:hypothetical protein BIT28_20170 [Photobacterium proteolyticum]|uniref:Uncharacterized protein n=1 Tax=Photobacterium proteolyticum TaxID=1903952 RepID=A0A1Q9H7K2_9GAMM|nr:hypothetical protein [Photobacterium proteolyticum]OLQ83785.1 hypothetical protein BIT28_20170 [Photobacterium proteolyticum]